MRSRTPSTMVVVYSLAGIVPKAAMPATMRIARAGASQRRVDSLASSASVTAMHKQVLQ